MEKKQNKKVSKKSSTGIGDAIGWLLVRGPYIKYMLKIFGVEL